MKIKLTLRRGGQQDVDLVATLDASATVADLATALNERDPARKRGGASSVTLEQVGSERVTLPPSMLLADSGLVSGATVAVVPATSSGSARSTAAAVLRVVEGPDAGKEFPLAAGTSVVGRASSCEVRLRDTSVSREHAKVHVTGTAEIVDLGSSNGVDVDGGIVTRAVLRPRDRVRLGDTVFTVEVIAASPVTAASTVCEFNRSPRLEPPHTGPTIELPEPPQRADRPRFPVIMLIAPLVMGAVLFAVTKSSTSLIFVALSPLMAVANVVEQRINAKRGYTAGSKGWRAELDGLRETAQEAGREERENRLREHPSTEDVRSAVSGRTPLLWSRRPSDPSFLDVRLGTGPVPTRTTVKLPSGRRTDKASWAVLEQFRTDTAYVADCPLVAKLATAALGIAGARPAVLASAYSVVQQVVGLHSPAEVVLAAVLPTDAVADWCWLTWLPHATSPHSPLECRQLAAHPAAAAALLSELERLVEARSDRGADGSSPAVVVLVEDAAAADRARLVTLADRGARVGVHVVWLSPTVERLPAPCGTFLDLTGAQPVVGVTDAGTSVPVRVEAADAVAMTAMARSMAPLVDSGAPLDDDSDLPRSVSWLSLHDAAMVSEPAAVLERWQESRSIMTGPYASRPEHERPGSLRAVPGATASAPHMLDLRTHGPHALVGGTTGSGKSELLRSWILSLAAMHSPQRVTFLLVDYKGGSAFNECQDLPHTVGTVTDLGPHLVRRALTSLSAELRYREDLLARKGKKDLAELEEGGDPDTPPSLVIVVDEFAALVQEVPEFVDGVINVAQRGRSLGLHLILATQRPAGVIKDNLRANTNLRIALRVADANDSTDVVGSPFAGGFDPQIPGRAVSKTGPGRLVPFQSAYVSGYTSDEPPPVQIRIEGLGLGPESVWEPAKSEGRAAKKPAGQADIARIVDTIRVATDKAGIPAPRQPYLPELLSVYELSKLPTRLRDDELVFGTADDPLRQSQPTIAFHPDVDGNMAVYGTGGSGKSALLRTLAIAAGFTRKGGPCHVYGLDFGARGLDMLEPLPHVGSVIPGADHERVTRLLGDLRALIDERAARYAKAKAGSITEYRQLAKAPKEPRILLLVDGVGAFRTAYESAARAQWFDLFQGIAADGRPVGVHVIVTADRPAAIPSSLGSAIQRRLVLRMADEGDYQTLGEPADVVQPGSPPGRGVIDGTEVQVAVLGGDRSTLAQAKSITGLAVSMRRASVTRAPAVERLTEQVALDALPATVGGRPVLGLAGATLGPQPFEPRGTFLVTGAPGSGRTTALVTLAESIRRVHPGAVVHYVGARRSPVASLPDLASCSTSTSEAATTATRLVAQLTETGSPELVVLIIESLSDYVNTPADMPLQQLVKALVADDHFVIAEGESSTLVMGGGLLSAVKAGRTGLALQPDVAESSLFRTDFPRLRRAELPPGRGLLVTSGRTSLVQVAMPPTQRVLGLGSAPHSLAKR